MKCFKGREGFTLIEIMLVMALLSILIMFLAGNFSTTLKRGRDQQRKNDLNSVQKALELYYEGNNTYPKFNIFSANALKKLCVTANCNSAETVYMYKVPVDPYSAYGYKYVPEPTPVTGGPSSYYYLYSYIENELDTGSGVSKTGFVGNPKCDTEETVNCRYYVSSSNAIPLVPNE